MWGHGKRGAICDPREFPPDANPCQQLDLRLLASRSCEKINFCLTTQSVLFCYGFLSRLIQGLKKISLRCFRLPCLEQKDTEVHGKKQYQPEARGVSEATWRHFFATTTNRQASVWHHFLSTSNGLPSMNKPLRVLSLIPPAISCDNTCEVLPPGMFIMDSVPRDFTGV